MTFCITKLDDQHKVIFDMPSFMHYNSLYAGNAGKQIYTAVKK
jgi:hypothetical protein